LKRCDALISIPIFGVGAVLTSCDAPPMQTGEISEEQLRLMLRQLSGLELAPGEWTKVLESLKATRFTAYIDPMTQPQSDFDPGADL
jgi:hypothetical protein